MATTGLTAQAVGRGDTEAVALVGLRHGFVAIVVGLVIILCRGGIRMVGFAVFQAAPEVTVSGQLYFDMMVWGAPATLFCFVCIGWLLGQSKSSWVLILAIVSNLSKVALDYFFIVELKYASAGAGAASAIAVTITALVALVMVLQLSDWRSVLPKFWTIEAFRDLFSLNAAIGVRTFALLSVFALFTQMSVRLGTEILTANTLILEVLSLAAYFIDGFAFATETYAGLFYSRGEWKRMKTLLILSGSCCLAFGLLFAIAFSHSIIWFVDESFGRSCDRGTVVDVVDSNFRVCVGGVYVRWLLFRIVCGEGFARFVNFSSALFRIGVGDRWILFPRNTVVVRIGGVNDDAIDVAGMVFKAIV